MTSRDVIEKARSVVGCPFRPQGRDPKVGVDCAGLVLWVFQITPALVRKNYRLRGLHRSEIEAELHRFFEQTSNAEAGDVLLCDVAQRQMHLVINSGAGFVHADAGLRRVVETPGKPRWPVVGAFRYPNLTQD